MFKDEGVAQQAPAHMMAAWAEFEKDHRTSLEAQLALPDQRRGALWMVFAAAYHYGQLHERGPVQPPKPRKHRPLLIEPMLVSFVSGVAVMYALSKVLT